MGLDSQCAAQPSQWIKDYFVETLMKTIVKQKELIAYLLEDEVRHSAATPCSTRTPILPVAQATSVTDWIADYLQDFVGKKSKDAKALGRRVCSGARSRDVDSCVSYT